MELKRILNPADDDTSSPRPLKRHSPSSAHLSSSPPSDVYETSSQPTTTHDMGPVYSYFHDQSSPSPSQSPKPEADEVLKSNYDGNYTHPELPDAKEGSPPSAALPSNNTLRDSLDLPEGSTQATEIPDDSTIQEDTDMKTTSPPSAPKHMGQDLNLDDLSDEERWGFYVEKWKDAEVELKDLAPPKLCSDYPHFADEILHAYVNIVLVKATIWSNYDSSTAKFFFEPHNRYNDCGKLYLSPNQRRRLNALDHNKFQLRRVLLQVGTPFRTLFSVYMISTPDVKHSGYRLRLKCLQNPDPSNPHPDLATIVDSAMVRIHDDGLTRPDQRGLILHDLNEIAKEFVLSPRDAERSGYGL